MISADVKANVKNNKKQKNGDCMLKIFIRSSFRTWNTMLKGHLVFFI